MAKKTRKQKILADARRQIVFLGQDKNKTVFPAAEKIVSSSTVYQSQSFYSYPIQNIRKDLTKTALLCILAISLEVALYFVLEKN